PNKVEPALVFKAQFESPFLQHSKQGGLLILKILVLPIIRSVPKRTFPDQVGIVFRIGKFFEVSQYLGVGQQKISVSQYNNIQYSRNRAGVDILKDISSILPVACCVIISLFKRGILP